MVCVVCMALFSFWTIARAVGVKSAELAVHTLFVGFAVITELMLVATNKKLVNNLVVGCSINNSTQLDAPVFLYSLLSLV